MLKKLLSMILFALLVTGNIYAQSGSVTGVVTDEANDEPMPAVTVQIVELSRGTATNVDGEYTISDIEAGTYTLRATFVGYSAYESEITIGSGETVHNIVLSTDILGLEDVVVTGVGSGTSTQKLGFSVAKIDDQQISAVPAGDVGSALRAKVPGVTIVKASGDPSSPATIRLRGTTSLGNDQSPLIIVDGVITDGSLADINMQDVESIEIVKGAAGASLYGSLAGNGVVQIITKRASQSIDRPQVTIRSEYGFSTLAKDYPVATTHPWSTDDVVLTDDGQAIVDWPSFEDINHPEYDGVYDNPYPVNHNNIDAIFTGQPFNSNYINLANSSGSFNYFASFENLTQGGVIENMPDYDRSSVRLNADYLYDDKFNVSFSGSYINTDYPFVDELGQSGTFYSSLVTLPVLDFTEKNPDGTYSNNPRGYSAVGSNTQNPLYVAEQYNRNINRERYIMGFHATYNFSESFAVDGRQSFDKRYQLRNYHTQKGYQTPTPSTALNNGYEYRSTRDNSVSITELWATGDFNFDELNVRLIGKYLFEDRDYERYDFSGYDYSVAGIRSLGALNSETFDLYSWVEEEKAENFILDAQFDYQDKIILGAMGRRDGSSSFGEDERYQFYYRGSLAYRLSEDIDFDNIQEFKLRASYGTSGQRPPYEAQFETYSAGATTLVPDVLGNSEIKPSVVAETEFGVDIAFLEKFNMTVNYAMTNVTNEYLLVPLGGDNPFSAQWQNVGEIETSSFEVALQGNLIQQRDLQAGFNLTFDMTNQEVTSLGGVPAFTRGTQSGLNAAIDLFRFEEGVSIGAMYGNRLISSVDELTVVDGEVVNIPGGYAPGEFTVNDLGHVVLAEAEGTAAERPIYQTDETGTNEVVQIGDTQPDFQVGLSSNLSFKNFDLFMVWDWSQGGEVYNFTKQLLYFNQRHQDLEVYTRDGIHPNYILQSDGLYNASNALSHYVEDASYIKLREVSLSYTLTNNNLGTIGNYLRDIQFSVVGRNLLTFTDYTGYDPEVALRSNASNFRIDEFAYPNFRTFTGSVRVRF